MSLQASDFDGTGSLGVLCDILDGAVTKISDILPSEWAEQNRYIKLNTAVPGPFSFNNSPYTREILDCVSPFHPAKQIAVKKGAQIGLSTAVIENAIGWIISENPANILFLVGHTDLLNDSISKLEAMFESTGIRKRGLIRPNSQRSRNTKSGDTDSIKEYDGGYLRIGVSNHKTIRNYSMQFGFIDDYDGMKGENKSSGQTYEMILQRYAAFYEKMKLYFISSPELLEDSNIEEVYLMGDQRKWHIPCPHCNELIVLYWSIESELNSEENAGITWRLDDNERLIEESVGYICQKCGNFFDDSNKTELIGAGKWIPTATPSEPGNYSYHINTLYAPIYMFPWKKAIYRWIAAHPKNAPRIEKKYKAFINTVLGECYAPDTEALKANYLQENNIRPYEVGIVPEKLSLVDGNGRIVLLTCGIDMNGVLDDARIDYEVLAWSENESTYSVIHGSIGTFFNFDNNRTDRVHWTYRHNVENSVWPELTKILTSEFHMDNGEIRRIQFTALDTGHLPEYAYKYTDNSRLQIVNVIGTKDDTYIDKQADKRTFIPSKNKPNLFLIETNYTKDLLAQKLKQTWSKISGEAQPAGFCNYPTPSGGKYLFNNFFSHYEAENKVFDEKSSKFVWKKKTPNAQNHLFDCRLYCGIAKDIMLSKLVKEKLIPVASWQEYINYLKKRKS